MFFLTVIPFLIIISPINVTNDGVAALLSNLKVDKASGSDGIPALLLKNLATTLAPPLTMISGHLSLNPLFPHNRK